MIFILILWVPIFTAIGYLVYAVFIAISPFFIIYYYFCIISEYLRIICCCGRKKNFMYLPDDEMLEEKNILNLQW